MFFTGVFSIDNNTLTCNQKPHEKERYDDNVISWFSYADEDEKQMFSDGYVSNKGEVATIHLRPKCMEEPIIEEIRSTFVLYEEKGVSKVIVTTFSGWDMEFFIRGINRGPFRAFNNEGCENTNSSFITGNNPGKDIYQCAVDQAWLDTCRTVRRGNNKNWSDAKKMLAKSLKEYFDGKPKNKTEAFDGFYDSLNFNVREKGKLNIGQAQKLINMAFKYLYCCGDFRDGKSNHFSCCHMPLDGYTLGWYKREVDSKYDGELWSKIDDLNKYHNIVNKMREYLKPKELLPFEFKVWQKEKQESEIKNLRSCAEKIKKSARCDKELQNILDEYCEQLDNDIQIIKKY